jgi:hypothetical protein
LSSSITCAASALLDAWHTDIVRVEGITRAILVQRGHRVLLDEALAELYGVETRSSSRPLNATGSGFRQI